MYSLRKRIEEFGTDVVKQSKKNVRTYKIETTGKLRRSIKSKVERKNNNLTLDFSMIDYGVLRDAGQLGSKRLILKGWNKTIFVPRGKGFTNKQPPINAISKWLKQKKLKLNPYVVARKIKTRGIRPGLFFSDAWNEEWDDFLDDIEPEVGKDVELQIKNADDNN